MADQLRVAYLITSYKLPDQVRRLATVLRAGSPEGVIIVHHDDRECSVDHPALETLGVLFVEPPSTVAWGEFSQLAMVLRCLRWVRDRVDFDWLVLISGQDYPIRPITAIEQSLADAEVDAFIGTGPCGRPPFRRAIGEFAFRYYYRWRPAPGVVAGLVAQHGWRGLPLIGSRVMPSGVWVGVRAPRSPFGPQLVCHVGSDWFTLSRTAVDAVDHFIRVRPEVVDFYRRTLIPTESFIHTVLANDDSLRLSPDNRRHLVFDAPDRSAPRILRTQDLDSILLSGADFARKFDETIDKGVLDEIDRRVHSTSLDNSLA